MNINTLDLNLLRVFNAVYSERNVSKAALTLGITQPAISNALVRLRRVCGDPLFVRTSKGMEPTTAAVEMSEPIRQAMEILKASFESSSTFNPLTAERRFKLLMSDAGETVILAKLMVILLNEAPHVQIETVQVSHDRYAQMLEDGLADLAFGNLPFLRAGFYQQKLFSDPYMCIANRSHEKVKNGVIKLADFAQASHIHVASGNADGLVDQAMARMRLARTMQLRLSNYHVAVEIVSKTSLLAAVPVKVITPAVQAVTLPFKVPVAEVRQFWHRRVHHDEANRWLRGILASLFKPTNNSASRSS